MNLQQRKALELAATSFAAGMLFLFLLACLFVFSGCTGALQGGTFGQEHPLRYVRFTAPAAGMATLTPDHADPRDCQAEDPARPLRFTCLFDARTDHATLRFVAPGFEPWQSDELDVRFTVDLPEDLVQLVALAPPFVPLPRLVRHNQVYQLETGERWTAIEHSDFHLLGRFLAGEDIAPILQQRADLGFNLLRVWTRYDLSQYGIGTSTLAQHPDLYDRIPAFLQLVAGYGLRVEFTAYTGREDFDPQHWNRLCAAVQSSTNVILELVNENDQAGNHIDVTPFAPCPGVPSAHGSNGSEQVPVAPFWDYAPFHTNGASEWWRKNGHNAMEIWAGPTLTNEATRCPDQDADPQHFEDAAAAGALLAMGSDLHTVHGKNSTLLDAAEVACAQAHVRGARSVNLQCQDGPYTHPIDLEGPADLRVYERPVPGLNCLVRIRR